MKSILTDFLICPTCLPQERKLDCRITEKHGGDLISGSLQCGHCRTEYPIQEGIAFLLPRPSQSVQQGRSRYDSHSLVSSYLWSHYGDLLGDENASTAYGEWANLILDKSGFSLDAGCAAGRFTFEMSRKSNFAVGIDNSYPFIRTARELMKNRQFKVSIAQEGLLMEHETIHLPESWNGDKVEFIVGDVQSFPFQSNLFSTIASLNLVDKVPLPLAHLKEMNRLARVRDAQFLFSDPFSWSSDIAKEDHWLGGTTKGPYPGKGIDNVLSLLAGNKGELVPPWNIESQGHIWWKIRNHRNHFELIRSCFIKANR